MFDHVDTNLQIVLILTFGFGLAGLLGYVTQLLRLSPLLGYLLAGFMIGPYSPGFVADMKVAEQLAEIGVILMMFGVGMHFKWEDLINVRNIAIPGAVGQIFASAAVGALLIHALGWSWEAGIVIGFAIGVASTVVLVRVLSDNNILNTPQGHIAMGWLIVEDIFTVALLLFLPNLSAYFKGDEVPLTQILGSILFVTLKFAFLSLIVFTVGLKVVSWILFKIARTRSHELFTLTILALIFFIATGSTLVFGTSIALGAFLAGMVVGRTDVRHQASANALPLKDAFVVLFFISVGMLFNPYVIGDNLSLFFAVLFVVLIVKPLAAVIITLVLRHSFLTALTVAIALAQIGEFSFILAEEAMHLHILPDEGYDIIVACALISISINPLIFKTIKWLNRWHERRRGIAANTNHLVEDIQNRAIIIGAGPIGKRSAEILEQAGFTPITIDRNVDTISTLNQDKKLAVYGDATHPEILKNAHVESASLLVITVPEKEITSAIVDIARKLNPDIPILVRVNYLVEEQKFLELGTQVVCSEAETKKAFEDALIEMATNVTP